MKREAEDDTVQRATYSCNLDQVRMSIHVAGPIWEHLSPLSSKTSVRTSGCIWIIWERVRCLGQPGIPSVERPRKLAESSEKDEASQLTVTFDRAGIRRGTVLIAEYPVFTMLLSSVSIDHKLKRHLYRSP